MAAVTSHVEITYTIPNGASSAAFALPATNSPVTVNATILGGTTRGLASAVLCYSTTSPATMAWTGHAPSEVPGGVVLDEVTTNTGTVIAPLNSPGDVVLRVSSTALNKIEIFNDSGATVSAVMEMAY